VMGVSASARNTEADHADDKRMQAALMQDG